MAYVLAFVLFLAALLAKATAFSLPAVILLICWWKRGRIRWRADILPSLPFFGVAVGLCLVTAWLEKNHDKASEIWLAYYKKSSGKASGSYEEALQEALELKCPKNYLGAFRPVRDGF